MTNLIYYEHIIESSLFNKIFMQMFMFSIYDIKKLDCQTCYPNIYFITIYLSQIIHKIIFIYLFILCTQFYSNDRMAFYIYNAL